MTQAPAPAPTILIVDDNEDVRAMLRLALPRFGFSVLITAAGEEAVEVYGHCGLSVDLVLSDVQMGPGMDGPQTIAALRVLNPGVRFCFMSGGTGGYSTADLMALGAAHVFSKPFTDLDAFARELREAAGRG